MSSTTRKPLDAYQVQQEILYTHIKYSKKTFRRISSTARKLLEAYQVQQENI